MPIEATSAKTTLSTLFTRFRTFRLMTGPGQTGRGTPSLPRFANPRIPLIRLGRQTGRLPSCLQAELLNTALIVASA